MLDHLPLDSFVWTSLQNFQVVQNSSCERDLLMTNQYVYLLQHLQSKFTQHYTQSRNTFTIQFRREDPGIKQKQEEERSITNPIAYQH